MASHLWLGLVCASFPSVFLSVVYSHLTCPVRVTHLVHLFRLGLLTLWFVYYRLRQRLCHVQRSAAIPCLLLPTTIFSISKHSNAICTWAGGRYLLHPLAGLLATPGVRSCSTRLSLRTSCVNPNLVLNKIRQTDRRGRQLSRVRSQEVMRSTSWYAKSTGAVPMPVSSPRNQVPREIEKWSRQTLIYRPTTETTVYIYRAKEIRLTMNKMGRAPSILWYHLNYIITYKLWFINVFKLQVCTVYQVLLEWSNQGV